MTVLLTCAGRRNYLVEYFRAALCGQGRVIAADMSPDAPAAREADASFVVPAVGEPGYVDAVLNICREQQVALLISLNDLELPIIATVRDQLLAIGTVPVVSEPEVINICFDKWLTVRFLKDCGLGSPRTFLTLEAVQQALERGEVAFPLIVKPRWGTASIGIETVHDTQMLTRAYDSLTCRLPSTILGTAGSIDSNRQILIQECIEGIEHGLDIVNDLTGQYIVTWAKRKLGMRAGETDKAVTVDSDSLRDVGARIGSALGHLGNLDCDVFITETGPVVLELNPRFGGGYPFSHVAGANLPAALLAWRRGEDPQPDWFSISPGIVSAKCDRLVTWSIT